MTRAMHILQSVSNHIPIDPISKHLTAPASIARFEVVRALRITTIRTHALRYSCITRDRRSS